MSYLNVGRSHCGGRGGWRGTGRQNRKHRGSSVGEAWLFREMKEVIVTVASEWGRAAT